jgi:Arc/MetJ-type ribon-helix-helix transcriptional regulator
MMSSMTTKIAVSLPDEQVAAARAAVQAGQVPSVSAYVSQALAQRTANEELLAMLDADDAELGPPAAEQYAWARRALGLDPPLPEEHGAERAG